MSSQIKNSMRQGLGIRGITLIIFIAVNVIFGFLGIFNIYGTGGRITAVTLVSVGMGAITVVAVIADVQLFRGLFSAPAAYPVLLAPLRGWKILLSRIVTIVVSDIVSFVIGIAGIVLQGLIMTDTFYSERFWEFVESGRAARQILNNLPDIMWNVIYAVLSYVLVITAVFFICSLVKSLFFRLRLKVLFGIVSFAVLMYVLSWLDLSLALVTPVSRFGIFFTVNVYTGFNAGAVGYLLISLIKTALLFFTSAHLIERKVNL